MCDKNNAIQEKLSQNNGLQEFRGGGSGFRLNINPKHYTKRCVLSLKTMFGSHVVTRTRSVVTSFLGLVTTRSFYISIGYIAVVTVVT